MSEDDAKHIAKITTGNRRTLPRHVRERLHIGPGDAIEFRMEGDRGTLRPVRRRQLEESRGIFQVDHTLDVAEERERAWSTQTRRLVEGVEVDRD